MKADWGGGGGEEKKIRRVSEHMSEKPRGDLGKSGKDQRASSKNIFCH